MLRDLSFRVRAIFRRRAVEQELDEEIGFHLDRLVEKHVSAGRSPTEAERLARLELGGVRQVKEDCREARGVSLAEDVARDLRYGLRQLRRSPGFTAVALLTLALGIGANTALFSVVNGVLLNPLPYADPDRLVILRQGKPNFATGTVPYLNFLDWQKENRSFAGMALYRSYAFNMTGAGNADVVQAQFVTSGLFPLLGVEPVLGRGFAPGEDERGRPAVAVISAGLWQRKFDGSPDVLGRTIVLDGKGYAVLGVMPAGFSVTMQSGAMPDVFVPIGQWENRALLNRGAGLGIGGVGRLRPGVSIEQAQADMDRVSRALADAYPDVNRGSRAVLIPFKDWVVGGVRPILLVLFGAVAIVLLIACVNVANLLLARATGRARELAIRVALGASRRRLVRQLVTESMLLALAGGGLGLLVAYWVTPVALQLLPGTLPRQGEIALDGRVLLFALGVSLVCGILFGLAPALRATDSSVHRTIKDGARGASVRRHRVQDILIVAQVAMVLVLLVGAGLMIRTLTRLWGVDPGFRPDGVTAFSVSFPPSLTKASPAARRAHMREVEARVKAVPGVGEVSLSNGSLPLLTDDQRLFWKDGQPRPTDLTGFEWTLWYVVGPEYRQAMGIPLLRGRFLGPSDDERAPLAIVIDDVFAREQFGAEDPIGKRLRLDGFDAPAEIVGVVAHVVQWGLGRDERESLHAQMYFSLMQLGDDDIPTSGVDMVAHASGTAPVSFDAARAALQRMNPEQVASDAKTMDQALSASLARQRFAMFILAVLAGLALLLASVGIYGVISYSVGQRTGEIGIRMALGARSGTVLRLVLRHGLVMAALGIAIGLGAALGATRLMAHLLYGVSATDPLTFASVAAVLTAVALAAAYLPARRATRVDPMIALRHD
jgi:predicted permease